VSNISVFEKNQAVFEKTARFSTFNSILHFGEFCWTRYFKFLNLILTQNLEIDSNFFRIFISKLLKI
jgi:hypothetical protein